MKRLVYGLILLRLSYSFVKTDQTLPSSHLFGPIKIKKGLSKYSNLFSL